MGSPFELERWSFLVGLRRPPFRGDGAYRSGLGEGPRLIGRGGILGSSELSLS